MHPTRVRYKSPVRLGAGEALGAVAAIIVVLLINLGILALSIAVVVWVLRALGVL